MKVFDAKEIRHFDQHVCMPRRLSENIVFFRHSRMLLAGIQATCASLDSRLRGNDAEEAFSDKLLGHGSVSTDLVCEPPGEQIKDLNTDPEPFTAPAQITIEPFAALVCVIQERSIRIQLVHHWVELFTNSGSHCSVLHSNQSLRFRGLAP